jgi:oligosaccharyltransferase complex subunit gamma
MLTLSPLQFGLQTAPVLFFFPPTIGPHAVENPEPVRYDFTGGSALPPSLPPHFHPPLYLSPFRRT